jgi:hypothetical protein
MIECSVNHYINLIKHMLKLPPKPAAPSPATNGSAESSGNGKDSNDSLSKMATSTATSSTAITTVEVSAAAVVSYQDTVNKSLDVSVWNKGSCTNWYVNERGQVTSLWPFTCWKYHQLTKSTDFSAYSFN